MPLRFDSRRIRWVGRTENMCKQRAPPIQLKADYIDTQPEVNPELCRHAVVGTALSPGNTATE